MKLDRIDITILCELQKNGRMTNTDLAKRVDLSPSPCLMRVKKLQAEGYICGYSAQIDLVKLGQAVIVFTEITLRNHRQTDFARFAAAIDRLESAIVSFQRRCQRSVKGDDSGIHIKICRANASGVASTNFLNWLPKSLQSGRPDYIR